ncbi:hypothetical protein [Microbacterium sp. 18062]|uniref:hypothetical protein n=1 Tax=Microbacterium sp. 18062 TaxID=2681410 RepID=UPI001357170B|nr:hypothetical protein [Microbacterium sp. 18062]
MRRTVIVVSLAAGTFLFAACGSSPDSESTWSSEDIKQRGEDLRREGDTFAAEIFADGVVTEDENWDAARGYADCMIGRGYAVSDLTLNPLNGLSVIVQADPSGRSIDVYNADEMECRMTYMNEVPAMYKATHQEVMDDALRVAVGACMNDAGYQIRDGATNHEEMIPDQAEKGWEPQFISCATDLIEELYPTLPYFSY